MFTSPVTKFTFNKTKSKKNATDITTRSPKILLAVNSEKFKIIRIPFTRRPLIWARIRLSTVLRTKARGCITSQRTQTSMRTTRWSVKRLKFLKVQTPKLFTKMKFGRARATSPSSLHQASMIIPTTMLIPKTSKWAMTQSPTTMIRSRLICLTKSLTIKAPFLAPRRRKSGNENMAKRLMVG